MGGGEASTSDGEANGKANEEVNGTTGSGLLHRWMQLMAEMTDFELMDQMKTRERRPYFLFKDRYYQRVFDIAYAILGNRQTTEEVTRQVFEHVWRQAEFFDPDTRRSVAIWLYETTSFFALKRLQRWPWSRNENAPAYGTGWGVTAKITLATLALLILGVGGYSIWATLQLRSLSTIAATASEPEVDLQELYQLWTRRPNTLYLTLRDPKLQSDTLAQLLWSPADQQAVFIATNFPSTPRGSIYQLWAVSGASGTDPGLPQITESAGTFRTPNDGTVQLLSPILTLSQPDQFLVTLESGDGSDSPQGRTVIESRLQSPSPPPVPKPEPS